MFLDTHILTCLQENSRTALFHAAVGGNVDVVKKLLERGADLNIGDSVSSFNTVEPPNKGHFGNNTNSAVMSLIERLSSSRSFQMYGNHREDNILGHKVVSLVERSNV